MCFIFNTGWYMDISKRAYLLQVGKPIASKTSYSGVLSLISDEIYRTILLLNFMAVPSVLHLIPKIGPWMTFVGFCWVSAIYCFDPKWANRGWSLETRLAYFEQHWAYFAGFGFALTLATFFIPQLVSYGVFAFLFPIVRIHRYKSTAEAKWISISSSQTRQNRFHDHQPPGHGTWTRWTLRPSNCYPTGFVYLSYLCC